jgi:hypothetical protein
VLQSPWKPLRDLVRGNVVTALENARLDALERQFRSTHVRIENSIGGAIEPQVADDPDGNATVVWRTPPPDNDVWSNRFE